MIISVLLGSAQGDRRGDTPVLAYTVVLLYLSSFATQKNLRGNEVRFTIIKKAALAQ
jgi:hypothetical protein